MTALHNKLERHTVEQSVRVWSSGPGAPRPGKQLQVVQALNEDVLELSGRAGASMTAAETKEEADCKITIGEKEKQKLLIIRILLEHLTGRKMKLSLPQDLKVTTAGLSLPAGPSSHQARAGWGFEYSSRVTHLEQEKVSFAAAGMIRTAGGREISFAVKLTMSREFYTEQSVRIRAGDAALTDPLVITLTGQAPGLTDKTYAFDLDGDGSAERVSFVRPGSGFLVIDANRDGVINNGLELFGPGTGDGFAELSQYDEDGNQWIDENDSVFDRICIWCKDENGNDVLVGLAHVGVGAICLDRVATSFAITDDQNNLKGQVRTSGIYVRENGSVGTVHQVDLVR